MTEIESAIALLKSCGLIILVPAEPDDPIPEPEAGQLWVAPGAKVTPRIVAAVNAPWVVEYWVSGQAKAVAQSRGSFLAWARRSAARPVMLPVREPVSVQEVQAVEAPQIVLPWWKRLFGARLD